MRSKFHTERAALFRHCRYHFFHLKELKPCKFHEIWCETPFQQITPTLILVLAQTVVVDYDQRQRKQERKHNSGNPLALHQNKLSANKVGNPKMLENSNFIWNRHILFLFVGQERDSELPSCVRFLLAPFTESLIFLTCRSHNNSRDRAKQATAHIKELHLAASLHCAVSWNRKSPITAEPAPFSLGHSTKTITY